jgi:hypothetical protein
VADKVNGRTSDPSAGILLRQAKRRNKSVFAGAEIDHHVGRSTNCVFQKIPESKAENDFIYERSDGGPVTGLGSLQDFTDRHWIG